MRKTLVHFLPYCDGFSKGLPGGRDARMVNVGQHLRYFFWAWMFCCRRFSGSRRTGFRLVVPALPAVVLVPTFVFRPAWSGRAITVTGITPSCSGSMVIASGSNRCPTFKFVCGMASCSQRCWTRWLTGASAHRLCLRHQMMADESHRHSRPSTPGVQDVCPTCPFWSNTRRSANA
jgi:hypothetical protein